MRAIALATCLITLHDPSGRLLTFDTRQIAVVQPADEIRHHLAQGTNAVVYLAGKSFAVAETREQIKEMIEECQE
jgi:hypothetical protein